MQSAWRQPCPPKKRLIFRLLLALILLMDSILVCSFPYNPPLHVADIEKTQLARSEGTQTAESATRTIQAATAQSVDKAFSSTVHPTVVMQALFIV